MNETTATRGLMLTLLRMAYGNCSISPPGNPSLTIRFTYIFSRIRMRWNMHPFYQTIYPLPGRTIAAAKFAAAFRRLIQSA